MASPLRPDADASPFVHPGDVLDREETPFRSQIETLADKQFAAEIFVRIFADCIPAGPYKGARRLRAGYHRMVAIAYVLCPQLFNGMNQKQVADELGLHVVVFRRIQREVEAQLATRERSRARRAP